MRKRRTWLGVAGGLLIIGGAYVGYTAVSGPSTGVVKSSLNEAKAVPAVQIRKTIDGQYASFSLHDGFVKTTTDKPTGNEVELSSFARQRTAGSWNAVVRIVRLNGQPLQQEGTFNFRKTLSDRFDMTEQTIGNNDVITFTDNQDPSFSKVAYLTNGDVAASVALMGGMPDDFGRLEAELRDMLTSWRWK